MNRLGIEPVTGPIGVPPIIAKALPVPGKTITMCQWFALCKRPAVVLVPHSTMGDVPACADCAHRIADSEGHPQ